MLTEREKKWLEERQNMDALAPCCRKQCSFLIYKEDCIDCNMFLRGVRWCPFSTDWRDAAEFEARVVVEVARLYGSLANISICPNKMGVIKQARINVEKKWMLKNAYKIRIEMAGGTGT
ncbi:MAG: hypothetical protein IJA79_00625 [Desulfovibrio sp.]|nr:hypothetical protein [Desulfovibrio sp.]